MVFKIVPGVEIVHDSKLIVVVGDSNRASYCNIIVQIKISVHNCANNQESRLSVSCAVTHISATEVVGAI